MPTRKTKPKSDTIALAKSRIPWEKIAKDRAQELDDLRERMIAKDDAFARLRQECDESNRSLATMTKRRDELHDQRIEALDMLRHMQAEALFWRGVACGIDPEKAADAEAARRGKRRGDLEQRMEAGDGGRPSIGEKLYGKSFMAGEIDQRPGRRY